MTAAAGNAEAEVAPLTLNIVTYNIRIGIPMERKEWKSSEADLRNTADVLAPLKADIIALQEVDREYGATLAPEKRRTQAVNQPRFFAGRLDMRYAFGSTMDDIKYPSDNAGYVEWGDGQRGDNNGARHGEVGNCVLSRLPFRTPPENVPLPRQEEDERRAALRLELLRTDGTPFPSPVIVYATHLQHTSEDARVAQMKAIVERASRESTGSIVFIMGDMNAPPGDAHTTGSSVFAAAFEGGFRDLAADYAAASGGVPEPTFPADHPQSRIDVILCNRKLKVLSVQVPPALASDHRPVCVKVELPRVRLADPRDAP
jgi:endonuclease/exonuclease/phosphatase family metal-dependent hydrolase